MQDKNTTKTAYIIAATLIIITAIIVFAYLQTTTPKQTITVSGTSTIDIQPDLTVVYMNIETTAETSEEAKTKNSVIYDSLLTEILKLGFERKDLETTNYNIYQDYDWRDGERTENGYRATHQLKIEFASEETEKTRQVIDASVNSGALISYINFELTKDNQELQRAEAIKSAAANAKIKAQAMADGLGKKLGKVISSSDSQFNYYPTAVYKTSVDYAEDAEVLSAGAINIQPEQQTVSASINVVYELI